jgi:NAD(P)H-nitrite reductase large subunit
LPTQSVVSGTALSLRPQEYEASRLGAYDRRLPMFERIEPEGLRWADGRFERVDILLWATGFRPAIDHLAPLHLRSSAGGIALERVPGNVQGATAAALDPRIHFVGYGPSASTIGASRAARQAARAVEKYLAEDRSRD